MKNFKWTEDKVYDFVNFFLKIHRIPDKFELENQEIVDSFKREDDPKLWHTEEDEKEGDHIVINQSELIHLIKELNSKLGSKPNSNQIQKFLNKWFYPELIDEEDKILLITYDGVKCYDKDQVLFSILSYSGGYQLHDDLTVDRIIKQKYIDWKHFSSIELRQQWMNQNLNK